ncbi:hypothetical protein B296_00038015 [Ensete ventricosum]|uniref:Uncharacterized protein n=1 Tax=Ensete ventricosum TaxID=4639 RepID=A0A426X872_ENSVE|nr:hypothetical protein B296_00038015 [Ensete ventricosum]
MVPHHACERPDVALYFACRSSVPARCSSAGCFTVGCPSPVPARSFTVGAFALGEGSPAVVGFFTVGEFITGEGCSSPTAVGSFTAEVMLLSSSRWFLHSGRVHSGREMLLPSGLGRFHSGMFLRWFLLDGMLLRRIKPKVAHALDHDLLLPFPEILGLRVASLRLQLVVQIFDYIFLFQKYSLIRRLLCMRLVILPN